jgi:hypothetical protein
MRFMCQYFKSERRVLISLEQTATRNGFYAAKDGKPKSANPSVWTVGDKQYSDPYKDDWDHGWDCWHSRVLPWAIQKLFVDERQRSMIKDYFKEHGILPEDINNV